MAHHKLVFDEDLEEPYTLLAIHCSEEAYKVAFLLNKHLNIRLKRNKKDLDFSKEGLVKTYPLYEYEDIQEYTHFFLVANKCKLKETVLQNAGGLFAEMVSEKSTTHYLLPEFKKVDYLLKIYSGFQTVSLQTMLSEIKKIKQVVSAYTLETAAIKSKNNLIFD